MALANNKELMIKKQKVTQAGYTRREAFAAYLPAFDFTGGYFYNQKSLSVFDSDQHLPVGTFNPLTQSYEYSAAINPLTGLPITTADGTVVPAQTALIPKEAMEFNIHNVFFGAVTLTQPLYMGGKIVALNRLARIGEAAAEELQLNEEQNVIYAVDAAYWTVVSLKAKNRLATSYVNLLDTLSYNVSKMVEQGLATRSDLLSVEVKLNEANVDLLKVENGLTLSRMALAQVCGLDVASNYDVEDEGSTETCAHFPIESQPDMEQVYANRHDVAALDYAVKAAAAKKRVTLADMLPNVALVGAYTFSTPNMFDGFKNRVSGMFSVGVVARIPLWHWGGNYNKYRAAATDETIMRLQLADVKEKVTLQVNQATQRAQEAVRTYYATNSNLEKAEENLRTANLGFREGVVTVNDVMTAQTAWLKAQSEGIDAVIEVELCQTYLAKVLGSLY
jgi:outer membrane protein TolC